MYSFSCPFFIQVALSNGGERETGKDMKYVYVVMIMAIHGVTEALSLEVTLLIPTVGYPYSA